MSAKTTEVNMTTDEDTVREALTRAIKEGGDVILREVAASLNATYDKELDAILVDTWCVHDGVTRNSYAADSPEEAIEQAKEFYDPELETYWVSFSVSPTGLYVEDGEVMSISGELEDGSVLTVNPEEPPCPVDGHEWESPHAIVGGLKESPGVRGHGGGVVISEVCTLCGCGKSTDTWAHNPETGEEGLRSIKYTPNEYDLEPEYD